VGGIALLVPPVDTFGMGVVFRFECKSACFCHGIVEGLDEVLQGHGYERVTGGGA